MTHIEVTITTPDGACPAHLLLPPGGQNGPAVILYMDAGGIRPAAIAMAARLAAAGHVVLLPDPFYRYGPYGPLDPREVFKGDVMAILGPLLATTGNARAAADTAAFLAFLDTRPEVIGKRCGAVGFCMGGGMAIAAAGTHPDRFAAVASFHGGNLATVAPDSPHLFADQLAAPVYLGVADNDPSYPPDMAARFEAALSAAAVPFVRETYAGAAHGWMVPDFPVYDAAAADRGWQALLAFFGRHLRRG
jgi:carboxymethylenebutenolidase